MRKRRFTRILALLLAMVMVFALPMEASASTRKVTATAKWKKAKSVKTGTTTVTAKSTSSAYFTYVKFKAPKTKTYKITISNLRLPGSSSDKDIISASVSLEKANKYGSLSSVTVKQNKKKTSVLWVCSDFSDSLRSEETVTSSSYVKSRTASIKIKKGQTIYICFGFSASGSKKCRYDLKIK